MTIKKLSFLLTILVILFSHSSFSQSPFAIIAPNDSLSNDSNRLYIHGDLTQFLKNNEYFSPIVEGYTLFGTNLKAGGFIKPSSRAKVYLGFNAIKFYGDSSQMTLKPECYIQYQFNKHSSVLMGSLYNRPELKLLPMLTDHETMFTECAKEGLAFNINTNRLHWDIWVAWLNYLHARQHAQEKIFLGIVLDYDIIKTDKTELTIPFQFTVYHLGGQINDSITPLHMMINNAFGLAYKYKFTSSSSITVRYSYVGYADKSSYIDYALQVGNGDGHFFDITYKSKHIQTALSYWKGNQFDSPVGEAYYSSISARIPLDVPSKNQKTRNIVSAYFYYNAQLAKGLSLMCGTQLFYDVKNGMCDYSYSFMLRYSGNYLTNIF